MIPKIIHYVWVGGNEKSAAIRRCMSSWKRHLGDYEIIEWNESNFDIGSHPYAQASYEAGKWAFVSDYIRAKALYEYGGIYLDTDVLVLDDLTKFLKHRAFVGFETPVHPFTAVFGAEKGHPFLKKILDLYDGKKSFSFEFQDNNTLSVSRILTQEYGCQANNSFQLLADGLAVYPDTVLCNPSGESSAIHVFTGTWLSEAPPLKKKINTFLKLRIKTRRAAALFRAYIMQKTN